MSENNTLAAQIGLCRHLIRQLLFVVELREPSGSHTGVGGATCACLFCKTTQEIEELLNVADAEVGAWLPPTVTAVNDETGTSITLTIDGDAGVTR